MVLYIRNLRVSIVDLEEEFELKIKKPERCMCMKCNCYYHFECIEVNFCKCCENAPSKKQNDPISTENEIGRAHV